MTLIQILVATFLVSLIAFIGIFVLLIRRELMNRALLVLVALSSGALLGGAFLHLIPETLEQEGSDEDIFLYLLLGFCLFFILEQFLQWHHQHTESNSVKPFSYLILISDAIHNFIDGLAIAAGFITGYQTGVAATLAIVLHEVPQEMGDFAVLVYGGLGRVRALSFNFISALTAIIGGVAGYLTSRILADFTIYLLPFAAGNFIYIAAADLIPEIKHKAGFSRSLVHFFVFLAGIGVMFSVRFIR